MVGAALLRAVAMAPMARAGGVKASHGLKASYRAFVAPSAAALRPSPRSAITRGLHSTVCAQSGLQKNTVTEGTGASPKSGDKVGLERRSGRQLAIYLLRYLAIQSSHSILLPASAGHCALHWCVRPFMLDAVIWEASRLALAPHRCRLAFSSPLQAPSPMVASSTHLAIAGSLLSSPLARARSSSEHPLGCCNRPVCTV